MSQNFEIYTCMKRRFANQYSRSENTESIKQTENFQLTSQCQLMFGMEVSV